MSVAVSSAPAGVGMEADKRMIQRRDSMAADERAKDVSKIPYDENVGKLNKFYRQGNCMNATSDCC